MLNDTDKYTVLPPNFVTVTIFTECMTTAQRSYIYLQCVCNEPILICTSANVGFLQFLENAHVRRWEIDGNK